MTVRRALAVATVTATALLALAGCGGNDKADKASDSSSDNSSSSASTPASSDAPSDAMTAAAGAGSGDEISGDEFAGVLKSALDKATTAHVAMDLGASAGSADGDVDYTGASPAMSLKMSIQALGGDVEMRLVDGTLYMQSATLGQKWISVPLDDPSSPLGGLGDLMDVKKALENFADAVTSATDDGTEDVDGQSLHHYTATVDTSKLLQALPSEAAGAGASSLPATMTQEWWFDSDGLISKFSGAFGATSADVTVSFSDWGKDVSIKAPPADQVTTMPGSGGA